MYYWQKFKNQNKLDKISKVRGLRQEKCESLLVKAFSTLLFHKVEMKRIKKQKRIYTFLRKSRVFKAWLKFVENE